MASPFPGMDPYLEPHWLDVHGKLAPYAADLLNTLLPDDLVARNEERLAVEADDEDAAYRADARVFEAIDPADVPGDGPEASIDVALAPLRLTTYREPAVEKSVRILDPTGKRLVTAIEFVSPWNKRRPGLADHRHKRRRLVRGRVGVVEVDLVRAGNWRRLPRPALAPASAATAYRATIWAVHPRRAVYLHPMPLRERLPAVSIPLRRGERPVELDVQALVDQVYRNGKYARTLDYAADPDPPLSADDTAWADGLLRAAGERG